MAKTKKQIKKGNPPKKVGRSAPLRVDELIEASYEAADNAMKHLEYCVECGEGPICETSISLLGEYQEKKKNALWAIREVPSPKRRGSK